MHWAMLLPPVVVVGMVAMLGFIWVGLKNQHIKLSEERSRGEKVLREWEQRNNKLRAEIARLKSPPHLQSRLQGRGFVGLAELEYVTIDLPGSPRERSTRVAQRQPLERREGP
jgi:hypothetical protein